MGSLCTVLRLLSRGVFTSIYASHILCFRRHAVRTDGMCRGRVSHSTTTCGTVPMNGIYHRCCTLIRQGQAIESQDDPRTIARYECSEVRVCNIPIEPIQAKRVSEYYALSISLSLDLTFSIHGSYTMLGFELAREQAIFEISEVSFGVADKWLVLQ